MKKITFKKRKSSFCVILYLLFSIITTPLYAQGQQAVSGVVKDTKGESLIGVSIMVKGTSTGTITDIDGNYTVTVNSENDVLEISYMGFINREIKVGFRKTIDIILQEDTKVLDELVVVGYGVQKKVNLTGSVSQVTAERLENRPVANIGQALQGVIPNLNVKTTSGNPNVNPSYNVRGGTSFSGNNILDGSPLILVDGVEMDINMVNPQDIESISVLKDAASAAVYGARAAYGVMLVTTRKGATGEKIRVSYDNSFQWSSPTAIPDLLNSVASEEARINAYKLENKSAPSNLLYRLEKVNEYYANPENVTPYYMVGNQIEWIGNMNPYKEAVKNNSPMQKHNISLSGSSGKSRYYVSLGYLAQDGLYKLNTDKFKRYNAMANLSTEINKYFSVEVKSSYNFSDYEEPVNPGGKGGWWAAMDRDHNMNINMPIKTPADSPVPNTYTGNILSFMDYGSRNKIDKETILMQVSPTITLMKGWQIKSDFAYKSYNSNRKQILPELERVENSWTTLSTVHTTPSSIFYAKHHSNQFTINSYTDYDFKIDTHNFYAMAGYNQEWLTSNYLDSRGDIILSPDIPFISQTLGNKYVNDSAQEWAIRGAFFRLTYNYDGKYLLETNGRYDGTSRFPKDSRFKYFQSFSGAWRISQESFAKAISPVVDDLKLRASYGSLGNQNVANYIYIPSYSTISEVGHLFGSNRPVGIVSPGLVSPDLTWEEATTINFGLDATLWKRLNINFDIYTRETTGILVSGDKFPAALGAAAPTKNSGSLKTNGWETTIEWRDQLDNGLNYDVSFVLSDYITEITKFDGNPNKLINTLYEGQKAGEIWGYETVGIFQTQEEIDNAPDQKLINSGIWYPGDVRYADLNNDGEISQGANTIENSGDRKIIGNNTPRYQFGLNGNLSYKGVDFNLFFQGVGKRDVWIGSMNHWGLVSSDRAIGTYHVYNNSWTPERTDALYPAYKPKGANIQVQSRFLDNAAYIRLKNITLGYQIPYSLTQQYGIEKLRIFGSAYNLWEYTKMPKLFDVETPYGDYPMMRSIAVGLQITF